MDARNLQIERIESSYDVKILLAVETGSRAWGLASPHSDIDIGMIYCHSPEWYLSVSDKKDTIDLSRHTHFDGLAWDLQKAFRLLLQSNAVLYEWLQSPVLHTKYPQLLNEFYAFARQCYNRRKVLFHYLGFGNHLIHKYKSRSEIPLKAYLLLIRSTLAAMWAKEEGTPPPVLFAELLPLAESQPKALLPIHQLVLLKKEAKPDKIIKKIPALDQFITDNRRSCSLFAETLPVGTPPSRQMADDLFKKIIFRNSSDFAYLAEK